MQWAYHRRAPSRSSLKAVADISATDAGSTLRKGWDGKTRPAVHPFAGCFRHHL